MVFWSYRKSTDDVDDLIFEDGDQATRSER